MSTKHWAPSFNIYTSIPFVIVLCYCVIFFVFYLILHTLCSTHNVSIHCTVIKQEKKTIKKVNNNCPSFPEDKDIIQHVKKCVNFLRHFFYSHTHKTFQHKSLSSLVLLFHSYTQYPCHVCAISRSALKRFLCNTKESFIFLYTRFCATFEQELNRVKYSARWNIFIFSMVNVGLCYIE